ncbi:molybdopterin-binding protein [Marinibacterium sp. SX1]|uniref:molybdopterin-binding protein n=1 Tax=Marinibacterium sp. SX1 TaxID=3388424 RepID=UPI003D168C23
MVDWSGGNDTGSAPRKDAIWACVAREGEAEAPVYLRNRDLAETWLAELIADELAAGRRLCLGFDFPFGYPAGFARALTGRADPLAVWAWMAEHLEDSPAGNNRFDLAGQINRTLGDGPGPFWFNGLKREIDGLPRGLDGRVNPFAERRAAEAQASGTFTCWQMGGAGAVGGQVMTGLALLHRLRGRFPGQLAAWPFEPADRPVVLVETWPTLIDTVVRARTGPGDIRDAVQVSAVAGALSRLEPATLGRMLDVTAPEEGWILGLGHEAALMAAADPLAPPPLRNDCFALPAGVDWTPVDAALALLRDRLTPVTGPETLPLGAALGRVLAAPVTALRANPPQPNTAVDGYGFAGPAPDGPVRLPLCEGRSAAGAPFGGVVPAGQALRVLTGAALPEGVDTVVLDEDVSVGRGQVAFHGPLKRGANTRRAGEDVAEGEVILQPGRVLTPADLALIAAVGLGEVAVRRPLKVGVLSTGDEIVEPGAEAGPGQIFDANRVMLLSMLARFGVAPVDLGRVPDDRDALRERLDGAAGEVQAVLTSGGASAGDEDHVSALLREAGALQEWRIALKPGRPLALGLWQGVPVFGLPGNPVAAMVCTLIFARPALGLLAGRGWQEPWAIEVPAAFAKRKKPGRREYLRARLRDGRAEVFKSEGSGRISGLSWAEGLVELADGGREIRPGDPVRFLPFSAFGL